jgi:catechol 2,3-dioxygenase-like lactoylglutathione lyase family enzyme
MVTRTISGIHDITAIASNPQRNLEFYEQVLALRLVKLTILTRVATPQWAVEVLGKASRSNQEGGQRAIRNFRTLRQLGSLRGFQRFMEERISDLRFRSAKEQSNI